MVMMNRMEFDAEAKTGRSEEKTNDLRIKGGKLQQRWVIMVLPAVGLLQVTDEWRDVPEEE
jgi:hypothetical protein